MTSLRTRCKRPSALIGSLARSIEASTVSVTPFAGVLTGSRTLALTLSAGHSPARAADIAAAEPINSAASAKARPAWRVGIRANISMAPLLHDGRCNRLRDGKDHRRDRREWEIPSGFRVDSRLLCWPAGHGRRALLFEATNGHPAANYIRARSGTPRS